eukprot:1160781-Pelagomonas_calceolata.AAC.8
MKGLVSGQNFNATRSHKDNIRVALVPGRGASIIRKKQTGMAQRVYLLGGPSPGSSVCRPGRLALMLGPSSSGGRGAARWVGCVQQEVMSLVHKRSDACSVSAALPFPWELSVYACWEAHLHFVSLAGYIRRDVLVLGGLAVGAGPGLTLGPCGAPSGDRMPDVSCGGRLRCWNFLCWVVVAGLRVSINVGGGVESVIKVCINGATSMGC